MLMEDSKVANSDGWYVYKSSDEDGVFMPEMWDWETLEDYPLVQQEVKVIYSLLEVLIRSQATEYGYYFNETYQTDEPSDLPTQWDENGEKKEEKIWSTVYNTPDAYYNQAGEYHIVKTHRSDEFTYYAISKHGCSFQSALTEYVRIRNDS
jgi:hypothetical protein